MEPKTVLVTGGLGFVGSGALLHLHAALPRTRFVNLDAATYCANERNVEELRGSSRYVEVRGSICDAGLVDRLFTSERFDMVLHCAAESHVDVCYHAPERALATNVDGTLCLLEAARRHPVRRFVHISTDEVYGSTPSSAQKTEQDALNPTSTYAASKAAAELLVGAYGRSFGLPYVILRPHNIYGPRQFPEKLIPKACLIAQKLREEDARGARLAGRERAEGPTQGPPLGAAPGPVRGQRVPIHGQGRVARSFLHIDDACRAIELILTAPANLRARTFNVPSSEPSRRVIDVVRDVLGELGVETQDWEEYVEYVDDRPFNDEDYSISGVAIHALGWKPEVPWAQGLRETVRWYVENREHWNTHDLTEALRAHRGPKPRL